MSPTVALASTGEIAAHFGVRSNVVSNWTSRYPDFPAPLATLAIGRVWDLNEVVDWFNNRWAVKGASEES